MSSGILDHLQCVQQLTSDTNQQTVAVLICFLSLYIVYFSFFTVAAYMANKK